MPIQTKLLLYMTVVILMFTVVLFSFNAVFTKKIYISHKKDILIESSRQIHEIIKNSSRIDSISVGFALERLERMIGGSIYIGTFDGIIYYPTKWRHGEPPRINPFFANENNPPPDNIISYESRTEDSFFMIIEDPNLKFETLRFQSRLVLAPGHALSSAEPIEILIWLPMPEISESIGVFNKIVALAAAVILVVSILWSLYVSGKFTKPIRQMNRIAKKISLQDFSETLEVSGNDELAELSDRINEISYKLSSSINRLNEKNLRLETEIINEKKLDRMRKEFVAAVSHELKTPIFLIQGYAEGLKKVAHKEEKRNFYCDVIINETEKMDKLLKDVLDLAQIESGMFVIQPQAFDLTELAKDSLHKFQPVLDSKKIKIETIFPDSLTVYADPDRVEQILVNFINNAIDHLDHRREIRMAITEQKNKANISVFNSGEHISDDVTGKLWTAFYKADKSRTREYGGTGLGLSIVKAIQEGHGNAYGVSNVPNGVEFWIALNLAKESE